MGSVESPRKTCMPLCTALRVTDFLRAPHARQVLSLNELSLPAIFDPGQYDFSVF